MTKRSESEGGGRRGKRSARPRKRTKPRARSSPARETLATRVAVFETGPSNQKRACDIAAALGYQVIDTGRDSEALVEIAGDADPPELILLGLPVAAAELGRVRGLSRPPLIVASVPGPAESARNRAAATGADLFVVRPHSKDGLAVVLHAAAELARARAELGENRRAAEALRGQIERFGEPDATTGFQQFEFFKRILVMELKRAKRYGYSLAAALVAFDNDIGVGAGTVDRMLREQAASAITASIRDIDLPVDYADGRILIFLPYTDLDGATEVGNRVAAAVRRCRVTGDDGNELRGSVSIGISAVRPGKPVSFARLMKDANQALRAAQLKGGGRVVVRT